MAQRKVTLKDVAKEAEVSTAAVSMALKNSPRIGKDTKKRIQRIARRLGYQSDPQISTLMHYLRTGTNPHYANVVGFLNAYPDQSQYKQAVTMLELFRGGSEYLQNLGYKLEHMWLSQRGMTEKRMNQILDSRNIRGLILPPHPDNHAHLNFDWSRMAVVSHALCIDKPAVHCVACHYFHAARLAYQRLYELGYRRIGFAINNRHNDRTEHLWTGGYMSGARETAPSHRVPEYVGPSNRDFIEWFRHHKPDALLIAKMDFWKALKDHGLSAPRDYAYAFLNLSHFYPRENATPLGVPVEYLDPDYPGEKIRKGDIAGVLQNRREIGRIAASLVVGALQQNKLGLPEHPHSIMVKGTWLEGKSAPPKKPSSH